MSKTRRPKTAPSNKKKLLIRRLLIVALVLALVAGSVWIGCKLHFRSKVNAIYDAQKNLITVMRQCSDAVEIPEPIIKADEISTLTDDILLARIKESDEELGATFGNSFTEFFNSGTEEEEDQLVHYTDLISVSDYVKKMFAGKSMSNVNVKYALEQYLQNMIAIDAYLRTTESLNTLYKTVQEDFQASSEHIELESVLEMLEMIDTMVANDEMRAKLAANATTIHRIIEAEYHKIKEQYISLYGEDSMNYSYFNENAQSLDDVELIRLIACKDITVVGGKINAALTENDYAAISTAQETLTSAMADYLDATSVNTETGEYGFWQNVYLALAGFSQELDEQIELDTIDNRNNYYETILEPFDDSDKAFYNKDYLFWTYLYGVLASDGDYVSIRVNYATDKVEYAVFTDGVMPDTLSERDNMLWVQAQLNVFALIMNDALITVDDNGQMQIAETEDEYVIGLRQLVGAWNTWGSKYVVTG